MSDIAIELACLSPLPTRKAPAKPPRLHSRRSSLANPLTSLNGDSLLHGQNLTSFSDAVSLCAARKSTCMGLSRQSSFSDIASMFSIDAVEIAERLRQVGCDYIIPVLHNLCAIVTIVLSGI